MNPVLLEMKVRRMLVVPADYEGPVEVLLGPALYAVCDNVEQAVSVMIKVLMNNPKARPKIA